MSAKRIEITVPEELWDQIEKARGHEPRAAFIKRLVEAGLRPLPGWMRNETVAADPAEASFPEPMPAPKPKAVLVAPGQLRTAREVLEKPMSRQVPSLRETWGR